MVGSDGQLLPPPDPNQSSCQRLLGCSGATSSGATSSGATSSGAASSGATSSGATVSSAAVGSFISSRFGSGSAGGSFAGARASAGCKRQAAHDGEQAGQFCILHRISPLLITVRLLNPDPPCTSDESEPCRIAPAQMAVLVWRETHVRDKVEMPPDRFSLRSAPWLQAKKIIKQANLSSHPRPCRLTDCTPRRQSIRSTMAT